MLVFSKTALFNAHVIALIVGSVNLKANRFYIGTEQASTFPTRMVVKVTGESLVPVYTALISDVGIIDDEDEEAETKRSLLSELHDLTLSEVVYITMPFILRRTENPHTTFKKLGRGSSQITIPGTVSLYVNGSRVDKLCDACPRARGTTPCTDYNTNEALSITCLNTTIMHLPEGTEPGSQLPDGTTYVIDERGEFSHEEVETSEVSPDGVDSSTNQQGNTGDESQPTETN